MKASLSRNQMEELYKMNIKALLFERVGIGQSNLHYLRILHEIWTSCSMCQNGEIVEAIERQVKQPSCIRISDSSMGVIS
jgi:hypothetical protein